MGGAVKDSGPLPGGDPIKSLAIHKRATSCPIADSGQEPIRVVYIAGIGRSGSTLLHRTLGQAEGFVAVGEVTHFFGRGLIKNERCACGSYFRDCPVWGQVIQDVEASGVDFDPRDIERFRLRLTESQQLAALMLLRWKPKAQREMIRQYQRVLQIVYGSLHRVTGGAVLVDSSKNVGYGRILQETPGIRLYVAHLVRDSRGVTFSLGKITRRPGTVEHEEHLDRRKPAAGCFLWSLANVAAEFLSTGAAGYARIRYTDFVRSPGDTVRRILAMAGELPVSEKLDHVGKDSIHLGVQHVLAGNPGRAETGKIQLKEDLEWRQKMEPGQRHLVTALTFPLLLRYGYLASDRDKKTYAGHTEDRAGLASRQG